MAESSVVATSPRSAVHEGVVYVVDKQDQEASSCYTIMYGRSLRFSFAM